MTTWNERIQQIMREEREASMTAMESIEFPNEAKWDLPEFWVAVQTAINEHVQKLGRTLDGRIVPTVLRMMADEHERVWKRLLDEGLTAPSEPQG